MALYIGEFTTMLILPGVYLESFLVDSWAEHLRQHDRFTLADRESEERVLRLTLEPLKTRHFLYADSQRE